MQKKMKLHFFLVAWIFFLIALSFFSGCATPPPPTPTSAQSLSFQVSINPSGQITTQFTGSQGNAYLGFYRIVINDFNQSLVGTETAVTTNPCTWTDYFELNNGGWIRNDRIAPCTSNQPQQFTGAQAITPGTISNGGTSFTIALSLPDPHLGSASQFNVSVITYIAKQSNPANLVAIDALGPPLSANSPINYISFNSALSNTNTMNDPLGDWVADPVDFPDITTAQYQDFDIASLTVQEK
jgi:hypothetical protein